LLVPLAQGLTGTLVVHHPVRLANEQSEQHTWNYTPVVRPSQAVICYTQPTHAST